MAQPLPLDLAPHLHLMLDCGVRSDARAQDLTRKVKLLMTWERANPGQGGKSRCVVGHTDPARCLPRLHARSLTVLEDARPSGDPPQAGWSLFDMMRLYLHDLPLPPVPGYLSARSATAPVRWARAVAAWARRVARMPPCAFIHFPVAQCGWPLGGQATKPLTAMDIGDVGPSARHF